MIEEWGLDNMLPADDLGFGSDTECYGITLYEFIHYSTRDSYISTSPWGLILLISMYTLDSTSQGCVWCVDLGASEAYLTDEVNPSLVKPPLNYNGNLAKLG